MNINVLSKYIILFLFAVMIVLSVLLAVYSAENKALQKANAVLKEQVALRDTAINEIDKNIASLQEQVKEAEQICNERIKARNDLLTFLSIEPSYDVSKNGTFFPQHPSFTINALGSQTGAETCTAPVQQKNKKNIDSSPMALNDRGERFLRGLPNSRPNREEIEFAQAGVGVHAQSDRVGLYEVISKDKSDYAVNAINSYWVQFTLASDSKK